MPTSGQDRIRQQWQTQESTGKSAKLWLIVRRTVATLLALGLIGAFVVALYSYMNAPKSYLAYYSANIYDPTIGAPVAFAYGDYEKIASLKDAFTESDHLVNPVDVPLTTDFLNTKLTDVASVASGSKNTLVVFLTAHGRMENGKAALLCEPSDESTTILLSDVLKNLSATAAGTKLLILDAGRDTSAPADAELSKFTDLVGTAVTEQNDPALWVFCANSSYEHSHVSPKLKQSLFNYAISEGLGGKADAEGHGDQDGEIDLDELYNFARSNVSAWVKGEDSPSETQTPQLFNCSSDKLAPGELKRRHLIDVPSSSDDEPNSAAKQRVEPAVTGGWRSRLAENTKEVVRIDELSKTKERFSRQFGFGNGETDESTGDQPADDARPAESQEKDTGSKTTPEAKVDKVVANKSQVAKAWQKIAQIESLPAHLRPSVANSQAWYELQRMLLWCEQVTNAGLPNEAQTAWSTFDGVFSFINNALASVSGRNARRQLRGDARISLALAEQGGASDGLRKFINEYDDLLRQEAMTAGPSSSEALKLRLSALIQPQASADASPASKENSAPIENLHLDEYYELKLVGLLGNVPEIDWELLRLTLSTRRLGEQVAWMQLSGNEAWRQSIEDADRVRLEGERLLLDQTLTDWTTPARQKLRDARRKYETAKKAADDSQLAIQERNNVLFQAPDYVRWAQLTRPELQELNALKGIFTSLTNLDALLVAPGNNDFGVLRELQSQVREFKEKASASENGWRVADYLATVLPNPSERPGLFVKMMEKENQRKYSFNNTSTSDSEPNAPSVEVATELAQLFDGTKSLDTSDAKVVAGSSGDVSSHDVLKWNSERFHRALADAPEKEVQFLQYAADSYRKVASQLKPSGSPDLDSLPGPALSFGEIPSEIPLESADTFNLKVAVNSDGAVATPIWLVAQYNEDLLNVTGDSTAVIKQSKLQQGAPEAKYPIHPSELKESPTPVAFSNDSAVFDLTINRPSNAKTAGNAKLILKAVSANAANSDYVRREIKVNLPGSGMVDIAVADQPDVIWNQNDYALHPLPNTTQSFVFNVLNRAKIAQNVEVSFWIPEKLPDVALPAGPQKRTVADRLLRDFGPLTLFGRPIPVVMPATDKPVRLSLLDSDPTIPPATNLLAVPKDGGITLRHGLIVKLTNLAKNVDETTLRYLEITPLRPRSYLTGKAQCDRNGRLQIEIERDKSKPNVIPSDGLKVVARSDGFSAQCKSRLEAVLKAPDYKASMEAYIAAGKSDVVAYVDVDGYPRVFTFKVPTVADTGEIPPADEPAVRISVPLPGDPPYAVKAPVNDLPVNVEIDAPADAFKSNGAVVQVGIDEPRLRSPEGDRLETLHSDRDVTVVANSFSPDGTLVIDSKVADFQLRLGSGLTNQESSLMGWLAIRGRELVPSNEVKIALDAAPPIIYAEIHGIDPKDPRQRLVETGNEIEVHVFTDAVAPDLSGLAKVEAVFESSIPKDAKANPWQPAIQQNGPNGRQDWVVKLKTDENLGTGKKWILIRAEDKVGNTVGDENTPVLKEFVQIVPKKVVPKPVAAAKNPIPKTNDVPIQVLYLQQPIPAKVTLQSALGASIGTDTTDKDGKHTFLKVPPGKYTLNALSTEARQNVYRKGTQAITVPAPPEKPAMVKLDVN